MTAVICKAGIANCQCTLQLHLGDGVYMCFIRVPAGEFMMGSRGYSPREEPMHRVVISQDFYLATTPVTLQQATVLVLGAGIEYGEAFSAMFSQLDSESNLVDQSPALLIAEHADACCVFLADYQRYNPALLANDSNNFYRIGLPSEAQWEYACKYGVDDLLEYYTGDGPAALSRAGWFQDVDWFFDGKGNSDGISRPVARKQPSALGLYDMHGCVWEWCCDHFNEKAYRHRYDGISDPVVVVEQGDAVRSLRGGAVHAQATHCRAAFRYRVPSVGLNWGGGFRVGLFPGPCQPEQPEKQQPG